MKVDNQINYKNRGMLFEQLINKTNRYYQEQDICLVYKKPTPIKIVKTKANQITEAYFQTKSTTDYNGVYQGHYLDFEAKQVNEDVFYLTNLHAHQHKHLQQVQMMGGISFILLYFVKHHQTFLIYTDQLQGYKKLSYEECKKHFSPVTTDIYIRYIEVLKKDLYD